MANSSQSSEFYQVVPQDTLIVSLSAARRYSGLSKTYFNTHVRPHLTEYRRGSRSIGINTKELTEVLEHQLAGDRPCLVKRPPIKKLPLESLSGTRNHPQGAKSGSLTSQSTGDSYEGRLKSIAGIV